MRPIDIRQYKEDLRKFAREYRESITDKQKIQMDDAIGSNVSRLHQYKKAKIILVYVSTSIEVETREIIKMAWQDGKKVAVPRCIPNTRAMEFHYIEGLQELAPGCFSVMEPSETNAIYKNEEDTLMLVPAFIFDTRGYRLGYGKGYYDRYMSGYFGDTVGLCYSNNIKYRIYHGRYDKAVNTIVTENWIRTIEK